MCTRACASCIIGTLFARHKYFFYTFQRSNLECFRVPYVSRFNRLKVSSDCSKQDMLLFSGFSFVCFVFFFAFFVFIAFTIRNRNGTMQPSTFQLWPSFHLHTVARGICHCQPCWNGRSNTS